MGLGAGVVEDLRGGGVVKIVGVSVDVEGLRQGGVGEIVQVGG